MNRTIARQHAVATGALLLVAACRDAATPTGPVPPPEVNVLRQAPQVPDLATLARTIPGFGGLYLDDDGVPTVYLTDASRRGAAQAVLAGYGFSSVRVRPGRYAYRDLDRWFRAVSPKALANKGVVFVDLDEANNRVLVGVEDAGAAATARGLAARMGLAAAVAIQEAEPIHFVETLRDKVRPVVGGLQIRFSGFLCSLGFNATRRTVDGFLTASHCSDEQGAPDGALYYQPLNQVPDEFIGTEEDDPKFFSDRDGCPAGRDCRFSDALFAKYASGASFDLGGIAAPRRPNGSLAIAGTFNITGEAIASVNQTVSKIGRTTGWSRGKVTNTCVNTSVSGTNIVQLCQTFVRARVGAGDSGSPVFMGSGDVTLVGILWGGNLLGTMFVYSPIANIEQELGELTTF